MLRLVGIGALGNMLGPAADHLTCEHKLGTFIRIYDHNPMNVHKQDRRQAWLRHGAKLVHSIEDLVSNDCDGIVICAGKNGDDVVLVADVIRAIEFNYQKGHRPFILHLSTVSVSFVEQAHALCQAHCIDYANYPLTGGAKGAKDGTMLILASGSHHLFERLAPILSCLGKPKFFDSHCASAAKVKFIGHLMVFNNLLGLSSAICLQERIVPLDKVHQTELFDFLNQGAGGCRQWDLTLHQAIANQIWHARFLLPHAVIDAIYTADLLIKSNMSLLTVSSILYIAAAFSFLLAQQDGKQIATQALLQALRSSEDLDLFIKQHYSLDSSTFLSNIIASLPKLLREKVKLDIEKSDFV